VRKIVGDVAARDMNVAINAKGRVDSMLVEVQDLDRFMGDSLKNVSQVVGEINGQVGEAVRSLQFEDIVTQVLGYAQSMLDGIDGYLSEAGRQLVGDPDPAGDAVPAADRLQQARDAQVAWRAGHQARAHKPATQESMQSGGVELF
jgi:methyl-accepting chemotaxis protein